jgi:hypothetical protein
MRRKPPRGPIRADLKRLREQEKETARIIAELKAHIATADDLEEPRANPHPKRRTEPQHRPLRRELDQQRNRFLMWLGCLLLLGYFLIQLWR